MGAKLSSPSGEPTKATYIFSTALLGLIEKYSPDMLVVAMDPKEPSFRVDIYPDYKATRPPMPDDLPVQIDRIEQILESLRIPMLRVPGFEADDVIGTLSRKASNEGIDVYICSRDKDMMQLVGDHVFTFDIKNGECIGSEEMFAKYGVNPCQFVDILALQGDSSDNVPGVPDVGPKTALSWIQKYGSLDNLYAHADDIGGKRGRSLREHKEQAYLSQKLVTIDCNAPLDIDFDKFALKEPDLEKLGKLFTELDFTRLMKQLSIKPSEGEGVSGKTGVVEVQADSALNEPLDVNYELIDTDEKFEKFYKQLSGQKIFAFDTETNSIDAMKADLVGLSFSWKSGSGFYLPVKAPLGGKCLSVKLIREKLGPIMSDSKIKKVGQNIKYDLLVMQGAGIEVEGVYFDTMVASYVLSPERMGHGLDLMAKDYLDYETISITELIGKGKNQLTFDMVDTEAACRYAAEDSDITWRLYEYLSGRLDRSGELRKLFEEVEMPLVSVLWRMESHGVSLDTDLLRKMSNEISDSLDRLTDKIYELAGSVFNIDSPKQLAEVLFDKLGMKSVKQGKTMRSTDASVLESLKQDHEIVSYLLEYRQLVKLRNTYVDKLGQLINPRTNRVHCSFNQTVTATGRLSSSDPNLQNIPIRTELGRKIRSAFIPADDNDCIVSADYSQIELRMLAHFSSDQALIKAFEEDQDIHSFVASQIYQVGLDEVTSQMRANCKAVNFGIIYGQGAYGLSRTIGISQKEAKEFINDYFSRYRSIKEFMEGIVARARKSGYAETILGRRRVITGLNSRNFNTRTSAERMAVNTTIQGSAADLIKIAMINIDRKIREKQINASMTLQIHDELVFEVPENGSEKIAAQISREMTDAMDLNVPLKVDVSVGPTWLSDK